MKSLLLVLLFVLAVPAFAAAPDAKREIAASVAQAARYQPGQSLEAFRAIEDRVRQSVHHPALRKEVEKGLLQLLGPESTPAARAFACKELAIVGSKKALPALAGLLKVPETTRIACLALTTYPPGEADSILRDAARSASGAAQVQILNTLGDRRDAKSVALLAQAAADTELAVAEAAIASLGKIGNRQAWQAVASMQAGLVTHAVFERPLAGASLACAENLLASGDSRLAGGIYGQLLTSPHADVRRSALAALLRLDKDGGEQRIEQTLGGSDSALKPVAIEAIRRLPSRNASEKFAAELERLSPEEKVWLIDSLAARGDAAARAAVADRLGAIEPEVRLAAIKATARMGGKDAVPLLARALSAAKTVDDRRAIESALVALPVADDTDKAIADEFARASDQARASLITVIALRQGPKANPLLLKEINNSDTAAAKAAFRALARTAAPGDAPRLVQALTETQDPNTFSEANHAAAEALARVEDPNRRSAIVRDALAQAKTPAARANLLGLLPACGDAPSLAALQTAMADADPKVRDAALDALADWPNLSAWAPLAAIYGSPSSEAARGAALRGLVRLVGEENASADPKLIEHYRLLLEGARTDADRKLILGALGGAANPDALQLAVLLLSNTGVRAEAEVAVKKIAEAVKAQYPQAAEQALQQIKR